MPPLSLKILAAVHLSFAEISIVCLSVLKLPWQRKCHVDWAKNISSSNCSNSRICKLLKHSGLFFALISVQDSRSDREYPIWRIKYSGSNANKNGIILNTGKSKLVIYRPEVDCMLNENQVTEMETGVFPCSVL